jgi:wyosine [tRNA(Phe)-imidazoG37] synthetase (radical SAM superfamily)
MPYIKEEDRDKLDHPIHELLSEIHTSGELNYVITRILHHKFRRSPSYDTAQNLIGTLEAVKLEFYRRIVAPYEDEKIEENGDL